MNFYKSRIKKILFIALLFIFCFFQNAFANESKTVFSNDFHINKIYPSMAGPYSSHQVSLIEGEPRQLLWITGFDSRPVDAHDSSKPLDGFMCHSNLNINMKAHRKLFRWKQYPRRRLFSLSEGIETIKFPQGFGIPVYSDEKFRVNSQALNHNIVNPDLKVKIKNTISFVRDADLKEQIQPLMMAAANGFVLLSGKDGYYGVKRGRSEKHGHGSSRAVKASMAHPRKDRYGRKFAGLWLVPPGRHTYNPLVLVG